MRLKSENVHHNCSLTISGLTKDIERPFIANFLFLNNSLFQENMIFGFLRMNFYSLRNFIDRNFLVKKQIRFLYIGNCMPLYFLFVTIRLGLFPLTNTSSKIRFKTLKRVSLALFSPTAKVLKLKTLINRRALTVQTGAKFSR